MPLDVNQLRGRFPEDRLSEAGQAQVDAALEALQAHGRAVDERLRRMFRDLAGPGLESLFAPRLEHLFRPYDLEPPELPWVPLEPAAPVVVNVFVNLPPLTEPGA